VGPPELVVEVKFTEWTPEGLMRHPIVAGFRDDKKPREVVKEKAKHVPAKKSAPALTNLDKIYFPSERITKGDVLRYYERMSKVILALPQGSPDGPQSPSGRHQGPELLPEGYR
jgi:bifunctional non-homologous end joining protein LigD